MQVLPINHNQKHDPRPAEELFVVFDTSRDGYVQESELLEGLIALADSRAAENEREAAKVLRQKDKATVSLDPPNRNHTRNHNGPPILSA